MDLKKRVEECLGSLVVAVNQWQGDVSVEVPRKKVLDALALLKNDSELQLDFLSDLFGVDNLAYYQKKAKSKKKGEDEAAQAAAEEAPRPPRFEVIYLLLSLRSNERLQVKIRVPEDDPEVDSAVSLWKAATWPEREAYDMYGIRFKGHPNLKRLLMWDEFPAHPLRKDYPLEGQGEERHLVYD